MLTIFLGITTLVCGVGWLAAKVSILSLIILLYERFDTIPTKEEISAYTGKAIEVMFGSWSKRKY